MRSFLVSVSLLCYHGVQGVVDVTELSATYSPTNGGSVTLTVSRTSPHAADTLAMEQGANTGSNAIDTQSFNDTNSSKMLTFAISPSQGIVQFVFYPSGTGTGEEVEHLTFGHAPEVQMNIIVPTNDWAPDSGAWATLKTATAASGIATNRVAVLLNMGTDSSQNLINNWDPTKVQTVANEGYKVLAYVDLCPDQADVSTCIFQTQAGSRKNDIAANIDGLATFPGVDGVYLDNADLSGETTDAIGNILDAVTGTSDKFLSSLSNAICEDSTLFTKSTVNVMWDQAPAPHFEDGPYFHGFQADKSALLLKDRQSSHWDSDLRKAHDYGYGWFYASEAEHSAPPTQEYLTNLFTKINEGRPSVTAKDDPHLTNTRGEHFDVLQSGLHTLLQIPRGAPSKDTLMRVEAVTQRLGTQCEDMFIRNLTISGSWTEKFGGALRFRAGSDQMESMNSGMAIGGFDFKTLDELKYNLPAHDMLLMAVPMGRNVTTRLKLKMGPVVALLDWVHSGGEKGLNYLNFGAYHLRKSGAEIGGILGEDSHAFASSRPKQCRRGLRKAAQSVAVVRSPDLGLDDVRLEDAPVGGAWKAVASLDGDDSVV